MNFMLQGVDQGGRFATTSLWKNILKIIDYLFILQNLLLHLIMQNP